MDIKGVSVANIIIPAAIGRKAARIPPWTVAIIKIESKDRYKNTTAYVYIYIEWLR